MLEAALHSQVRSHEAEGSGGFHFRYDEGPVFFLLECPACLGVILERRYHHDMLDGDEIGDALVLYPVAQRLDGLPAEIERKLEAAQRVRNADANAFGVLIGRLLDAVARERGAVGANLYARLESLATGGHIPGTLLPIAHSIRQLRNVGAHDDLGELTERELPLLEDLAKAVLEYVYRAPLLAARAAERLRQLRLEDDADAAEPRASTA